MKIGFSQIALTPSDFRYGSLSSTPFRSPPKKSRLKGGPGSTGSLHARRSWHRRLPLHPRRAIAAFRPRPLALHRVPLLFALGLALLSVPILLQPGRYLADTHDTLWFAPGWYLRHSLSVWQDSAFLRGQPSLAPMAAFVWALRSLGFSLWLVQRLWYGVLMATAGVGAALLVHQLHPRLPSVGGGKIKSAAVTAGTSMCRSMRSSSGPDSLP